MGIGSNLASALAAALMASKGQLGGDSEEEEERQMKMDGDCLIR